MNDKEKVSGMPDPVRMRLKSAQGLSLKTVAPGQLHRLDAFGPESEKFVLVLDVGNDHCDVLPGSLDGSQAGPCDIVLPKSVMGGYVMLGLNAPVRLRQGVLGNGFARLDADVFRRIVRAFVDNARGKKVCGFVRGYPYVSERDDRLVYRQEMIRQVDSFAMPETVVEGPFDVSKMTSEEWQEMVARRIAERRLSSVWRRPLAREENSFAVAAAEKKAAEFFRAERDVEGTNCIVRLVYDQEGERLSLQAFDVKGDVSATLDGWKLVDGTGKALGEVKDGAMMAAGLAEFDGVCCLVDQQGGIHALIERSGDR